MELNRLRDSVYDYAKKKGYHDEKQDVLSQKLMLVVGELAEAMEAERKGKTPLKDVKLPVGTGIDFEPFKGTIEEEIADAVIRLADIAGMIGMDLDWWVNAKMNYNRDNLHKVGKLY